MYLRRQNLPAEYVDAIIFVSVSFVIRAHILIYEIVQ